MENYSWNDGHLDGIGESILGLSLVLLFIVILSSPLEWTKGYKSSGGCCNATDTELMCDK